MSLFSANEFVQVVATLGSYYIEGTEEAHPENFP